ncbi:SDR family NAD(P)-dependent oxidoreductase [Streptomyces sp. NPDC007904]|uniref:SDR family NAD(P)-dependent oxidoreductase n=1 Tax=Streptomyces sp. NPDC007904 TaxID=3364787 RepID=UPI0036EBEF12
MTDNASNDVSLPVAGVPAGLLAGRVAVITGASAGIGAATAHRFAAAGAAVALLGRRSGHLEDLAATLREEQQPPRRAPPCLQHPSSAAPRCGPA